jgi:hypothetical protein
MHGKILEKGNEPTVDSLAERSHPAYFVARTVIPAATVYSRFSSGLVAQACGSRLSAKRRRQWRIAAGQPGG